MNSDRKAILALVAMGRITPAQAERLIAASNDSRETTWIFAACLAFAVLAQLHLHEFVPGFIHLFNAPARALAEAICHALSPITGLMGGLL
jgi:hypothetical protein